MDEDRSSPWFICVRQTSLPSVKPCDKDDDRGEKRVSRDHRLMILLFNKISNSSLVWTLFSETSAFSKRIQISFKCMCVEARSDITEDKWFHLSQRRTSSLDFQLFRENILWKGVEFGLKSHNSGSVIHFIIELQLYARPQKVIH